MLVRSTFLFALPTLALIFAGCGGAPDKPGKIGGKPPAGKEAQAHETIGPHGGHLIELGKEEYHAELVHDDKAKSVTIYVLDSSAKKATPIDASDVTINLKHDGKGEQFKLAAAPQESDPKGKSSRFASDDAELAEDLDAKGTNAQLVLEIAGQTFRGKIEHGDEHGNDLEGGGHKHK